METYADLEITLSQLAENVYMAALRFDRLDNPAQYRIEQAEIHLDLAELRQKITEKDYGILLRDNLFSDPELKKYFNDSLNACQAANLDARLRLIIDRSASALHSLRWETLLYPDKDDFMTLDSNLVFSRFIFSQDMSKVELRPKEILRALVIVAAPQDLDQWGLDLVETQDEVDRAKKALKDIKKVDVLAAPPVGGSRVTQASVLQALQHGYDIVHLVCHGKLDWIDRKDQAKGQRPYLWLEKDDGDSDRVDGETLVRLIAQLDTAIRPRLVFLASCQSAGKGLSGDEGVLAGLGPRLAEVGVTAVVAMQANISMTTVEAFVPAFYAKLLATGRVDQAMVDGRAHVQNNHDWWVPVLFLRLRSGRLWYEAGVADPTKTFEFWRGIKSTLKDKKCTPVLGAGMMNFLAGSQSEIAHEWAKSSLYPLVEHGQYELHQVAQYMQAYEGVNPANHLVRWFASQIEKRFATHLPQAVRDEYADFENLDVPDQAQMLNKMISAVGRALRQQDLQDPYTILADLPVKVYITTIPDSLLEDALRERKPSPKEPQSLYLCWRSKLVNSETINRYQELVEPTVKKPLVYHLFGSLDALDSLVLTEDDFFEYLMWINKPSLQVPIPSYVTDAWDNNALLFLGFQMSDWKFRVLFRSILNDERRATREQIDSLAVQIQPGEDHIQPQRAQRVLERMFLKQRFDLYWGRPVDFLKDLHAQMK